MKYHSAPGKYYKGDGSSDRGLVDVLTVDVEANLVAKHVQLAVGSCNCVASVLARRHLN